MIHMVMSIMITIVMIVTSRMICVVMQHSEIMEFTDNLGYAKCSDPYIFVFYFALCSM